MKLFLAGGECLLPRGYAVLKRMPYLLFSYFTCGGGRRFDLFARLLKGCSIGILDSGAYSILYGAGKFRKIDYNSYARDYISAIKRYRIKNYIELDFDGIFDTSTINAIRAETEKSIGWPSIPCWHIERGEEELLKLASDYDYIAIGGLASSRRKSTLSMVSTLLRKEKRIPKIHLMGVNEPRYFNDIFFSADCSMPVKIHTARFACGTINYAQRKFGGNILVNKAMSLEAYLAAVRYYDSPKYLGESNA